MSLPKPDYEKWRHVHRFTCLQAAYLWLDIEPQSEKVEPPESVKALSADLESELEQKLRNAGHTVIYIGMLKLTRNQLVERWAALLTPFEEEQGLDTLPKFLNSMTDEIANWNQTHDNDAQLTKISQKSLLTAIYCLKKILLGGIFDKQGKEVKPLFNSQDEIADYIEDQFPLLSGTSKRTTKEIFAKANEIGKK